MKLKVRVSVVETTEWHIDSEVDAEGDVVELPVDVIGDYLQAQDTLVAARTALAEAMREAGVGVGPVPAS